MPRIPKRLVCLGALVEIKFKGVGKPYRPIGFDLCASPNGRELWVIKHHQPKSFGGQSRLYSIFTDYEPDSSYKVKISEKRLVRSRKVAHIVYRSDKWSQKRKKVDYVHRFKRFPTAYATDLKKPGFVRIMGGNIRVRAEGIIG